MPVPLSELLDIQRAAVAMLRPLARANPATIMAALMPQAEDYAAIFVGDAAEAAHKGYAQLWAAPPNGLAKQDQTDVIASATHAESLGGDTDFPGGYRKIVHLLEPGVVWLTFTFVKPGGSLGMTYDGLVWRDGRWAWFPKPWRILEGSGELVS